MSIHDCARDSCVYLCTFVYSGYSVDTGNVYQYEQVEFTDAASTVAKRLDGTEGALN